MFVDQFDRADGALGNGWLNTYGTASWTISSGRAVSGTSINESPGMDRLLGLTTQLRAGFRLCFRWYHTHNTETPNTPGLLFGLENSGPGGVAWEVKPQVSNGSYYYQFHNWGGTMTDDSTNVVSENDTAHDVEYIVRPSSMTLVIDGEHIVTGTHETDLALLDNPRLWFSMEGLEGIPVTDPRYAIDYVQVLPLGTTLAVDRVSISPALTALRLRNERR